MPLIDTRVPPEDIARLFVALWPPAELAAALCARYDATCGPDSMRTEAAERLHLTLHFIGDVQRSRLPELQSALCVPFDSFELRIGACERWPGGLVVARPDAVPPALTDLHAALRKVLDALGLRTDDRPFRPHITLARRDAGPWPAQPQAAEPLRWPVRHYLLAESLSGSPRAYRVLKTCAG
ncbi:MAG: RNA 2',3'-cyclic phosphodiesterase [Burkholderiaceae bacterium]|nr:RNA 2',3'-cyclic phosphodiesterase [Burkholderiaceae bacterium]